MSEENGALSVFLETVTLVELGLCAAVAVVLARRWRAQRSVATGSAFGVFAVVALVLAGSQFDPADATSGWGAVYGDVLICVLLTVPYLLVRFTWALGGVGERTRLAMAGLLAVKIVATLVAPPLPEDGADQPGWYVGYLVLVLGAWSLGCLIAAAGLWRAGRGQSGLVRKRMRSLSIGGLLLAATLIATGVAGDQSTGVVPVVISLLGLASIVLFALAFLPPPSLRLYWRQEDLAALTVAERGLMRALTRQDVGDTIVPVVAQVFGGGGAALLDDAALPVCSVGLTAEQHDRLSEVLAAHGDERQLESPEHGLLASQLTHGWLVVGAARLAPVFGDDEAVLLERVGTLVDLALQRVELFEQERLSRRAAETANAELETLLYSVSHDLRSPLISVLGYLDVLRQEHGSDLTGEGPHYLERISVNAVYMQSLIADLLELSRIGRSDPPPVALDLQPLAEQVLDGARMAHTQAELRVDGVLPVVRMSDVRMRQLVTNLVDNALKHGGRDDLRVTVSAQAAEDGGVRLLVADDGRGVPAEYRTRVLRVFERLDAARSSSGTGMGLAICKRIVESVGGALEVGGPPPGAETGTTICITFPAGIVVDRRVPGPREASEASTDRTLTRNKVEESA